MNGVYPRGFILPTVGEALSLPQPRILGSTQINVPTPVGVANLATRRRMVLCGTLDGTSSRNCPLASPRGKPRTQKILANIIHRSALLRGLRVAKLATPTEHDENRGSVQFNLRHSLSFAQQLPQRGRRGHFVPSGG